MDIFGRIRATARGETIVRINAKLFENRLIAEKTFRFGVIPATGNDGAQRDADRSRNIAIMHAAKQLGLPHFGAARGSLHRDGERGLVFEKNPGIFAAALTCGLRKRIAEDSRKTRSRSEYQPSCVRSCPSDCFRTARNSGPSASTTLLEIPPPSSLQRTIPPTEDCGGIANQRRSRRKVPGSLYRFNFTNPEVVALNQTVASKTVMPA